MKKRIFLFLAVFIFTFSYILPSGFSLSDNSARAMGMGFAFTGIAGDIGSIFYNPAGAVFIENGVVSMGSIFLFPSTEFTGMAPYPGEDYSAQAISQIFALPQLYAGKKFGEKLFVGIGVYEPFGLGLKWDEDWAGKYVSVNSEIKVIDIAPTIGFKVSDNFAIAGSLIIRNSKVINEVNIPFFNPFTYSVLDVAKVSLSSDFSRNYGYKFGVLYKFRDWFNIGISYAGKMNLELSGQAEFEKKSTGNQLLDALIASVIPSEPVNVTSKLTLPSKISIGIATYKFEGWVFDLDFDYITWSDFDKITIESEYSPLSEEREEIYNNTYAIRLGFEREINERFTIRGGYYFDHYASEPETVSPALPDTSLHVISLGVSALFNNLRVDVGTSAIFGQERSTEGKNLEGFDGIYSTFVFGVGFDLVYTF